MKWIRLFEGFNTDEYYVKITFEEYCDLRDESSEGYDCLLTDKEKLWIEENLPVEYWQYSTHEDIFGNGGKKTFEIAIGVGCDYGSGKFSFLYKIEDDYFLFSLNEDDGMTYYKCDQWEGLLMLLKDKKVI